MITKQEMIYWSLRILSRWRKCSEKEKEIASTRAGLVSILRVANVKYQGFAAQRVSRCSFPFSEKISETATVSWRAMALPRLCDL